MDFPKCKDVSTNTSVGFILVKEQTILKKTFSNIKLTNKTQHKRKLVKMKFSEFFRRFLLLLLLLQRIFCNAGEAT